MQCAAAVIVHQVLKASFCVNSWSVPCCKNFIGEESYEDKCLQIPFALKLTEFGLSVWRIGLLISPLHLCPCLAKLVMLVHDWKPGSCLTLSLSIDKMVAASVHDWKPRSLYRQDGGRFGL